MPAPERSAAAPVYLAVSRMRPVRMLVEQAGVDFCRQHRLVPVGSRRGTILVAAAAPRRVPRQDLERRLRAPVVFAAASSGEIAIAISNATEGAAAATEWRRAVAHVLVATRRIPSSASEAYVYGAEGEAYLGAALVEAGRIDEAERIEAVGLAFHLPHAREATYSPAPGLADLLDATIGDESGLAPLRLLGRDLLVACVDPPRLDVVERVEQSLGRRLRPLLVAPAAFAALRHRPGEAHRGGDNLLEVLRGAGIVRAEVFAEAERLSRQSRIAPIEALVRVSGMSLYELKVAVARASGLPVIEAVIQPSAGVPRLPRVLAEALCAVPVARDRRGVTVATSEPWDLSRMATLAGLLGSDVRPALASPAMLAALMDQPASHAEVSVPGDAGLSIEFLLGAGLIDRERMETLGLAPDESTADALTTLLASLDEVRRADALALLWELPRVDALLRHPDPDALTQSDDAILLDGEIVTVAVSSIAAAEAQSDRGTARPSIASDSAIAQTRQLLSMVDLRSLSPALVELSRALERRGRLDRASTSELWRRVQTDGTPTDLALPLCAPITPEEVSHALAAQMHAEPVSLARREILEPVAAGAGALQRVLADPVDHGLARLLTLEQADRLGAVPYRTERGQLVIAVADPLDPTAMAELRTIFPDGFEVRPAPRYEIAEAILRAHGRPSLGEALLESAAIRPDELAHALRLAARSHVRLTEALMLRGVVTEVQIAQHLARQHDWPYVALRGVDLDPAVAALIPEAVVRAHYILPIATESGGEVVVAVEAPDDPEAIAAARAALGGMPRFVVTTRSDLRDALERLYSKQYLETSALGLRLDSPENSAYRVLSPGQKRFFIATLAVIFGSGAWAPIPTVTVLLTLTTFIYLSLSLYKFYLIVRSLSHNLGVDVSTAEIAALVEADLPIYTVLVPLYHESDVLPVLVASLERLDYPKENLDVKLLLEEDDVETIAVARAFNLPAYFDITVVPHGLPKGKPKACNYGLLHARGSFLVIFDAEDVPEPDQLKKALVAFEHSAPSVVCVQAKLSYYNRDQNILTRWFTAEYALWFDLFLPGLEASGAPIPLGGTSNHFKIDALRAAGAWDPFNVTEDADLGLRIFKLGGGTAVVDSTTYEEANSVLDNWIRQRSRWVKGYIQTYLVHMRHPLQLWRSLGTSGFLSFQLVVGGTVFSFLVNPVLWAITGLWFATEWGIIQEIFPSSIYYVGAVSLYAGNFAFAYMNVAGCLRRRYYSLVKWALLTPIYWILMSIAAWKGFLQLFYKPFYWEKTIHGLSDARSREGLARITGEH